MNLYIMRHGSTCWNELDRCQGRSQNRLSKNGVLQTMHASEGFRDVAIDVIYVSPLMRTMQTANIMNKYHSAKIIKDDRIIEIERGIFTGRFNQSLNSKEREQKKQKAAEFGMESYKQVMLRAGEFVDFLKNECSYENVLVVTHCIVATYIEYILYGYTHDYTDLQKMNAFDNSEIRKYTI